MLLTVETKVSISVIMSSSSSSDICWSASRTGMKRLSRNSLMAREEVSEGGWAKELHKGGYV